MTRQQMWLGLRYLALFAVLVVGLAVVGACKPPGRTDDNVDDPNKGTAQCVVSDRSYNSNGTLVLTVDCNGGGKGYGPGGGVRAEVDPNAHPKCRTGAAWPGCREQ